MDLNTLVDTLRELDRADTSDFMPLAKQLADIKASYPKLFPEVIDKAGIKRRRAFMLAKVNQVFVNDKFAPDDLRSIGWAKLYSIAGHVSENPRNTSYFMNLARNCTARELTLKLNGLDVAHKTHSVLLSLPDPTYRKLQRALVRYGAEPVGRGLAKKEAALEALLDRLEVIDEGTPPPVRSRIKQPPSGE